MKKMTKREKLQKYIEMLENRADNYRYVRETHAKTEEEKGMYAAHEIEIRQVIMELRLLKYEI